MLCMMIRSNQISGALRQEYITTRMGPPSILGLMIVCPNEVMTSYHTIIEYLTISPYMT